MKRTLRIVLPIGVLVGAAIVTFALVLTRPTPETRIPETPVPIVRVQEIRLEDVRLSVKSQGTVSPRTESVLVPEVSGRIIEVSRSFVAGGFFELGETLLRIDPDDYRLAVVQARSRVVQAELRVAQEEAEAEVAREEWSELGAGEASPLTLREPQLADARAALAAARAGLERAERDLARTEIRAPYAGRVREKSVDVGQFVSPGTPLATVYSVDYAEVRLPLPDADLAFIDLPLDYRGEDENRQGPEVVLSAEFAGRRHEWHGRIVRTEGEIDSRTRMLHTVARVEDPYGRGDDPDRPPLSAGMFVEAEILGRRFEDVAVLPRAAIRGEDRVLILDDDNRLRFRPVQVLRRTREEAIVRSGLEDRDRVCLSPLAAVTDGMRVRTTADSGES